MTRPKSLTRVIDFLFESSLSPSKNAKRLESDSDESLTRPNTRRFIFGNACVCITKFLEHVPSFFRRASDKSPLDLELEDFLVRSYKKQIKELNSSTGRDENGKGFP
jgi:hypothetical protein